MDPDVLFRPEAKRAFVRRMFDGIAGTYDLLNHLLSAGIDIVWRRRAIDGLRPAPGWRVLDLATGTGDLGFEAADRHAEIQVVGVDLSIPMLQRATRKAGTRPGQTAFLCGDAERLPFPDRMFEGVTIGFGIRNLADLNAGLGEMYRVLRPDGRLAVLEFSRPRAFLLRVLYLFYFKNILPLIGRIVSRDPHAYRYLYESVMRFPEGADFCRHLLDTGFVDVVERRLTFGIATLYLASKTVDEVRE